MTKPSSLSLPPGKLSGRTGICTQSSLMLGLGIFQAITLLWGKPETHDCPPESAAQPGLVPST